MNKKVLLCLLLACCFAFAFGCGAKNPEENIVGKVNGEPIYESEVLARADALQIGLTVSSEETTREAKKRKKATMSATLDGMLETRVLLLLAKEYGTDSLNEEQEAEIRTSYESTLDAFREYIEQEFTKSFSSFTSAQVEQGVDMLLEMQGTTRTGFLDNLRMNRIISLTKEAIRNSVGSEQIRPELAYATYEQLVEEQKRTFEQNASKFESMYTDGDLVVYVPEGYREVVCVRQPYTETDRQIISQLRAQQQYAQAHKSAEKAFIRIKKTVTTRYDEICNDPTAALQAMRQGADNIRRIYVCKTSTGYTDEELEGIFAMEETDDVCGPYAGILSGNIYILVGEVDAGTVPFEAVSDAILALTLENESDQYLNETIEDAMERYHAVAYYNRF